MRLSGRSRRLFGAADLGPRPGRERYVSPLAAVRGPIITIDVPRAMTGRVEIHTASGDVRIEGVTGEIALNSMSGDVRVVRTSGELALQTASGDLLIEGASGRFTAHTASGDVRVISAQIDGFHVQTANGDILLDATLRGEGPFHAQTASGDVRLTLRATDHWWRGTGRDALLPHRLRRRPRDPAVSQDRPPALASRSSRERTAHRRHDRQRRSRR